VLFGVEGDEGTTGDIGIGSSNRESESMSASVTTDGCTFGGVLEWNVGGEGKICCVGGITRRGCMVISIDNLPPFLQYRHIRCSRNRIDISSGPVDGHETKSQG
jgi:hypothetical protein